VARIGVLSSFSADAPTAVRYREAFLAGLRDLGQEDGRNISIEFRYAAGQLERSAAQAAELTRLPVDSIVLSGDVAVAAARQATETIPIVFALNSAPVEAGLVHAPAWRLLPPAWSQIEARHRVDDGGEGDQRLNDLPTLDGPADRRRGVDDRVVGPDPVVAQRLGRRHGDSIGPARRVIPSPARDLLPCSVADPSLGSG
jgi:hypothetical protein